MSIHQFTNVRNRFLMMFVRIVGLIVLVFGFISIPSAQTPSRDWPQWRGPNRDGTAPALTIPKAWPEALTQKWKAEVGIGYSTPVLVGNRVYMFSRRDENEVLAAFDADSGKELWQTSYAAPYTLVKAAARHGLGPKSTPAFANGKLFTIGISGILSAFDAASGKQLWQKPAPAVGPTFSTSTSPIVDRGLLVVHVGGNNQGALTAFDLNTGTSKWQWTGDGPGYSSPMAMEIGGVRQIVTFTQQNLVGVAAETGELLWSRPYRTPPVVNSFTPIIYGDTIIVSGQEQGTQAFRPVKQQDKWTLETVWENDTTWMHLSTGVLLRDTVFGFSPQNRGQFFYMDAKTGKMIWTGEPRAAEHASILKSGNLLLILEDDGELVVADGANTSQLTPIRRYKVAEQPTWAQPAVSGNRIFVKDLTSLALWTVP
jgi:outer membrane protein assembly factor BamB